MQKFTFAVVNSKFCIPFSIFFVIVAVVVRMCAVKYAWQKWTRTAAKQCEHFCGPVCTHIRFSQLQPKQIGFSKGMSCCVAIDWAAVL